MRLRKSSTLVADPVFGLADPVAAPPDAPVDAPVLVAVPPEPAVVVSPAAPPAVVALVAAVLADVAAVSSSSSPHAVTMIASTAMVDRTFTQVRVMSPLWLRRAPSDGHATDEATTSVRSARRDLRGAGGPGRVDPGHGRVRLTTWYTRLPAPS